MSNDRTSAEQTSGADASAAAMSPEVVRWRTTNPAASEENVRRYPPFESKRDALAAGADATTAAGLADFLNRLGNSNPALWPDPCVTHNEASCGMDSHAPACGRPFGVR